MSKEQKIKNHEKEVDKLHNKIKKYGYENGIKEFLNIENIDIFRLCQEMDFKFMYYSDLYDNLEGFKTIKDLFDFIEGFEICLI